MAASWHLAPSLDQLGDELDAKYPNRSKTYDGTIGDAAHAARASEHNPDRDPDPMPLGAVSARDVTAKGIDVQDLLDAAIGDPRVWYVIYRGTIWSRTHGWKARRYTGDPHTFHVHISLVQSKTAHDSRARWLTPTAIPVSPKPSGLPKFKLGTRALKRDMTGTDVQLLQRFIGRLVPDGNFGPLTEARLKQYQAMRGLPQSGVAGPAVLGPIARALGISK